MKKIFSAGLTGAFLVLATAIGANGQLASYSTPLQDDYFFFKKSDSKGSSAFAGRNDMNARAMRNFMRSYQNVSGENWFELKDWLVVLFSLDNVNYQVAYNKQKGRCFIRSGLMAKFKHRRS